MAQRALETCVHGSLSQFFILRTSQGVFFGGVSDGSKLQQFSGTTPQDQYQILLASFHSLSSAQSHMLELVNSGTNAQSPRFDIDSVTITVGDGNPSYALSTAEQRYPA
jgi:hypothetical protein